MTECNEHLNCTRGVDECGIYTKAYLQRKNCELRGMASSTNHPDVNFAVRIATIPKHPEYISYAARLATFDRWPTAMTQTNKETLATAGFYYTGNQTLCYSCGGGLKYWEPKDNPWDAEWFTYCPYYYYFSDTSRQSTRQVSFAARIASEMASGPKYLKYDSYAARLASFDRCPKAMSQTKETLATAGFYYTGDQTLCYYCGKGWWYWDPEDDPWVKHAKWFAYCPYLILTKGTEFISSNASRTDMGAKNILSAIKKLAEEI